MTALRDEPLVKAVLDKFPGAEIVDVKNASPDTGATAEGKPPNNYSVQDLVDLAIDESARLISAQTALVNGGDRREAHNGQIERSRKFEMMARMMERCKVNPTIMAELRGVKR